MYKKKNGINSTNETIPEIPPIISQIQWHARLDNQPEVITAKHAHASRGNGYKYRLMPIGIVFAPTFEPNGISAIKNAPIAAMLEKTQDIRANTNRRPETVCTGDWGDWGGVTMLGRKLIEDDWGGDHAVKA